MEKFQSTQSQALKYFTTADHLAHTTYGLLQEPKLLITILENLHNAVSKSMDALVYYEKYHKTIDPVTPSSFIGRMEIMESRIVDKHKIGRDAMQAIKEIQNLVEKRKSSSMEFIRKEKYILASDTYSLSTLDIEQIKAFIRRIRPLIDAVSRIK